MSKIKIVGGIVLVLVIGVIAIGILSEGEPEVTDDIEDNTGQPESPGTEPEPEPEPITNRQ